MYSRNLELFWFIEGIGRPLDALAYGCGFIGLNMSRVRLRS